jgi:hypothetical protein
MASRFQDSSARKAKEPGSLVETEELLDADVPAAVVCAQCGDADCPGCLRENTRSGVVAVVPWERPGASSLVRLWTTARATTIEADRFFEALPDGPLLPALRFAVVSEVLAAMAMGTVGLGALVALSPQWARHVFVEEWLTTARVGSAAVLGLAALLVVAHAAHGLALDFGARRSGVRRAPTRALRFGLYAAGWDLVLGPIGAVVMALREGPRAALRIAAVSVGLPGRSARAFLRGCYHLEGKAAEPALRASLIAAIAATLVGAVITIAAILIVLLA